MVAMIVAAFLQVNGAAVSASFSSYARGQQWDFAITRAMLDNAPSWRAESAWPPLSPRRAKLAARQQLAILVSDAERWRLDSVSLRLLPDRQRWIYVVVFWAPPPTQLGGVTSEHFELPVLMDGSIVEPKRQPWPAR